VDVLSGGERNRVHLAKMLKTGANVILLDEPTNDLDVNTMRALEDALENFAGCALVISHDRWSKGVKLFHNSFVSCISIILLPQRTSSA
jgi:ATPase subunit of ABC transporter with duplicated ATPase domains